MENVILKFENNIQRDHFVAWLLDGGGEQDYFNATEDKEGAANRFEWDKEGQILTAARIDEGEEEE